MQFFEEDTVKVVFTKDKPFRFCNFSVEVGFDDVSKTDVAKIKMMLKKRIGVIQECDITKPHDRTYMVKFVDFDKKDHLLWFAEEELILI